MSNHGERPPLLSAIRALGGTGARRFGAVNTNAVNCGSAANLDDLGGANATKTYIGWFRPTSLGANRGLICKGFGFGAGGFGVFTADSAGNLQLCGGRATTDLNRFTTGGNIMRAGQWRMVAVTVDHGATAGQVVRLYHGGVGHAAIEHLTFSGSEGAGAATSDAGNDLLIGNMPAFGATYSWVGEIGPCAVFDRALDVHEVRQWQVAPWTQIPNLRGLWLPGMKASRVMDWSGFGNHGTPNGTVLVEGPPIIVPRRRSPLLAKAGPLTTVRLGVFDPHVVAAAWFDEAQVVEGWFDSDLVDASAAGSGVTADSTTALQLTTAIAGVGIVGVSQNVTLPLGTTSTGAVLVQGAAASTLPPGNAITVGVVVQGAASSALVIGGTATAVAIVGAAQSTALPLTVAATGVGIVGASQNVALPLTTASAGVVVVQGAASTAVLIGSAIAVGVLVQAAESTPLPLTIAADGVVVTPGGVVADSTTALPLASSLAGAVLVLADATKALPVTVASAGSVAVAGAQGTALVLGVSSAVGVLVQGTAASSLPLTTGVAAVVVVTANMTKALTLSVAATGTVNLVFVNSVTPLPLGFNSTGIAVPGVVDAGGSRSASSFPVLRRDQTVRPVRVAKAKLKLKLGFTATGRVRGTASAATPLMLGTRATAAWDDDALVMELLDILSL